MRIIFENQDKSIGILIPTQECIDIFGIEAIAKKDVPSGLPYWIVEDVHIPESRTFRGAWEIDRETIGEPHAYGYQYNTFEEVLEMLKINIEKAKEIKKNQLRAERALRLEELDREIQKYMLTDIAKVQELEAERQRLRDITLEVDKLETVEELKYFTI